MKIPTTLTGGKKMKLTSVGLAVAGWLSCCAAALHYGRLILSGFDTINLVLAMVQMLFAVVLLIRADQIKENYFIYSRLNELVSREKSH